MQILNKIMFSVHKINFQLILATIIVFVFLTVIAIIIYYCISTDLYKLHIWMVLKYKLLIYKTYITSFFNLRTTVVFELKVSLSNSS